MQSEWDHLLDPRITTEIYTNAQRSGNWTKTASNVCSIAYRRIDFHLARQTGINTRLAIPTATCRDQGISYGRRCQSFLAEWAEGGR